MKKCDLRLENATFCSLKKVSSLTVSGKISKISLTVFGLFVFFFHNTDQEIKDKKQYISVYVISCFNLFSLSFHYYSFVPENKRRHNVKRGV